MQVIVGALVYRKMHSTSYGQGTGRLSPGEIAELKKEVWDSIDALLAISKNQMKKDGEDETFWMLGGNGPTEADTTLYGFVASSLVCDA